MTIIIIIGLAISALLVKLKYAFITQIEMTKSRTQKNLFNIIEFC